MPQGERVEIKRRADGQYQWARIAGNNQQRYWKGEGLTDETYAWNDAIQSNPGVPIFMLDEEGGIVEERRPDPEPSRVPDLKFAKGERITHDGREYVIVDVSEPDNDGRFRMELANAEKFEETL